MAFPLVITSNGKKKKKKKISLKKNKKYLNEFQKVSLCILTVYHSTRVGISVCSVSDAPTAKLICLLYCHVFPVTAVHHTVGVAVPTAGGKHAARQTRPIIIHIVQTRTLQNRLSVISSEFNYFIGYSGCGAVS